MSNVKRMEIWTATRTVLKNSPGIKAKELLPKLREKTDLSRSTIYVHLGSFALQGKIYRKGGRYWLEKPEAPRQVNLSETHIINVASGLKSLLYNSKHRYCEEGELKPNYEYEKFALQHLEAYPKIYAKLPHRICERYFPKEMKKLRKDIKTLPIYFRIKRVKNQLCESLMEKLKEKNVRLKNEQTMHVIETLIGYILGKNRMNEMVWTDPDKKERVGCGDRVLCSLSNPDEANDFKERIKASILDLLPKEEIRLQKLNRLYDKLAILESKFDSEARLLILKLRDMKDLDGKCAICKGNSKS